MYCCADPAQPLATVDEELDYLLSMDEIDHDLFEVCIIVTTLFQLHPRIWRIIFEKMELGTGMYLLWCTKMG